MAWAEVRDLRIYYELAGSGPRLLFLSGTGGDLRRKPSVFERPIGQQFEILTLDQRGLGQTLGPDREYTMLDYAEDAIGLLDAVGWDRCHVMGVSFGGMVAQELAIRYPDRFDRVVLCCTSSGGTGGASYPLHLHLSDTLPERAARQTRLADIRKDDAWCAAHPDELKAAVDQILAGALVGADEPGRAEGYRRQLLARQGLDTYDRLPSITSPVFICGGRYDGIAPIKNQLALERQIPNNRLELFEGGHGFLNEDPRAYERVIAFLKGELDGAPVPRELQATVASQGET
jgi:3-oxoadipate enol-lactonase